MVFFGSRRSGGATWDALRYLDRTLEDHEVRVGDLHRAWADYIALVSRLYLRDERMVNSVVHRNLLNFPGKILTNFY